LLRATLERREWFRSKPVAQIALEIGDALDAMHHLGLIHRDVKPANILLDRERDRAVLVDVGVAVKAAIRAMRPARPAFAAPNRSWRRTAANDGRLRASPRRLYCLITGRPRSAPESAPQVVQPSCTTPMPPAVGAAPRRLRSGRRGAVDRRCRRCEEAVDVGLDVRDRTRSRALERGSGEVRLPPIEPTADIAVAAAVAVLKPTEGIRRISQVIPLGPRPAISGALPWAQGALGGVLSRESSTHPRRRIGAREDHHPTAGASECVIAATLAPLSLGRSRGVDLGARLHRRRAARDLRRAQGRPRHE